MARDKDMFFPLYKATKGNCIAYKIWLKYMIFITVEATLKHSPSFFFWNQHFDVQIQRKQITEVKGESALCSHIWTTN